MKAVVLHGVDDLRVEDVPEPELVPGSVRIRVEFGGICGSDLHYWRHGGAGTSIVREPIVLGHEIAGRIVDVAVDVSDVEPGEKVTVHPATFPSPCAIYNGNTLHLSPDVDHLGSAARLPHSNGAFSEYVVVSASQIRVLPPHLDTQTASVSEPLAVALHAVLRAGDLQGKRVVVNGAGPIGCLIIVSALAAGASEICVGDITDRALTIAAKLGAHRVVNIARDESLTPHADVVFEATGVPQALRQCFDCVRPGGKIVQVGMLPAGDITLDLARLVTREVDYLGSFRFLDEVTDAVNLLAAGTDLTPMLTHTFDVADAESAFRTALDRTISNKVVLKLI